MHYTGQDMLWLIGSLSRVFRIPFDPQLIRQQFPPPYSRTALLNALQALEFKVGEMELDEEGIATLERIPFPVVAFVREDEPAEQGSDSPSGEASVVLPSSDKPAAEHATSHPGEGH